MCGVPNSTSQTPAALPLPCAAQRSPHGAGQPAGGAVPPGAPGAVHHQWWVGWAAGAVQGGAACWTVQVVQHGVICLWMHLPDHCPSPPSDCALRRRPAARPRLPAAQPVPAVHPAGAHAASRSRTTAPWRPAAGAAAAAAKPRLPGCVGSVLGWRLLVEQSSLGPAGFRVVGIRCSGALWQMRGAALPHPRTPRRVAVCRRAPGGGAAAADAPDLAGPGQVRAG